MQRLVSTSGVPTRRIASSVTLDAGKAADLDREADQAVDRVMVQGRREALGIAPALVAGRELAAAVDQAQQADQGPVADRRTARALDTGRATAAGGARAGPDRTPAARDMERDQALDMDRDPVLDTDRDPVTTDRDRVLAPRASAALRGEHGF